MLGVVALVRLLVCFCLFVGLGLFCCGFISFWFGVVLALPGFVFVVEWFVCLFVFCWEERWLVWVVFVVLVFGCLLLWVGVCVCCFLVCFWLCVYVCVFVCWCRVCFVLLVVGFDYFLCLWGFCFCGVCWFLVCLFVFF